MTASHDGRRLVVGGRDPAAAALGLAVGLPIGEAQARIPGLSVVPADAAGDAAALVRIARLCVRFGPHASVDGGDGVLIDTTGCAHLFGGERRLLAAVVARFAGLGLACRAAIAGTVGAAHAVARFGSRPDGGGVIVRPGTEGEAIAGFPPEALRLEPALCRTLRGLGLDTVGALARLPRGPLARRFGNGLALRLDQAMGVQAEPIRPIVPARPVAARLGFVEPLLTAESFAAVIDRLLEEVASRLEATGRGARRLELGFERVDGSVQTLRVATARPVRDARQLSRLFADRLETVDPGLGVEAMRLLVRVHAPLDARQTETERAGRVDAEAGVASLIDTLANRLGTRRVWRTGAVQSDLPERSVARVAPLASGACAGAGACADWPAGLARPVRLIDPPQPVDVMALLPDHPPASFVWRRVRHLVRHADGPERIAGEWWRSADEVRAMRDYFRIEDEHGQRFWLFRRGDGADPATGDMRWFLHGLF